MSASASGCPQSGREFPMVAIGTIVLLALAAGCTQRTQAKSATVATVAAEPSPPQLARDVLERVEEAYHRADSYQDAGRLIVRYTCNGKIVTETSDFSLAASSPNRLRMRAFDGLAVCDGQTFRATIDNAPGEVLGFPAPEELSPVYVYGDPVLGKALNQIVGSVPLTLYLDPAPLRSLLYNAQSPQLDSPAQLGSETCYRVRIERHEGLFVLWIDQKDFIVRRVDYPPDGYRRLLEPLVGEITDMTITADLADARLNPEIDDSTFQFEMPSGAELVKRFDAFRLGSRIPKFKLETLDGQVLTRDSLADKIVVVKFWQTDDVLTYRADLAGFEQIQKRYQDEDSIVFLAVSADHAETPDDDLRAALERANLSLRVARIKPQVALRSFGLMWVPTTVIVGRDGTLQEYMDHIDPNQTMSLPKKLDTLLAGGDLFLEAPAEVQDFMFFSGFDWQNPPPSPDADQQAALPAAMAKADLAPLSQPEVLRIKQLWSRSQVSRPGSIPQVRRPGNILVIPDGSPSDRVFILDGSLSVAEVGTDGNMSARHRLELPFRDDSAVTFLRTATDGAGNRYFLGSKAGVQQVHLFDARWRHLLSFPEAGSHPGISDATLADLDGDENPEMLVGYLADVGVHSVTLEGERLWRSRAAESAFRLAVTGPNRQNQRQLLVAQGAVLPIDSAGRAQASIALTDAYVRLVFTGDLDGDQAFEWCAIALKSPGPGQPPADVAVGLSPDGTERWRYPLPEGAQHHPAFEMVTSGNLLGGNAGQWVIAGADGSIHLLDIAGRLIDRFNYGAAPTGMAIAKINGRPALIVATDESVEAWQFESPRRE